MNDAFEVLWIEDSSSAQDTALERLVTPTSENAAILRRKS